MQFFTRAIPMSLSLKRHDSATIIESSNKTSNGEVRQRIWSSFNPKRQFCLLKAIFIVLFLVDIVHWAYLLRDDNAENPNSWRFYKKFQSFDTNYLIVRMFSDTFTCVLGLGAAMWTHKPVLALPCTIIQLVFLLIRAVVWTVRSLNKTFVPVESTIEDKTFVACEIILPSLWALLSIQIVRTMKHLRPYELHGYANPPVIVLTVKNDENDESVQIEIA